MNATIAIPVEGDEIFQHFGKASKFIIYTIFLNLAAGIIALAGVSGAADEAVGKLIAGTLEALQTANCGHHGGGCGGIEYLPRRSRAAKRALAQCGHCGHGGCCH